MSEIIVIGSYQPSEQLNRFIQDVQHEFKIHIRYLQEYTALGTGGGMYHFRDQILTGSPKYFFVMNCDVCCDFPLKEMLQFHEAVGKEGHFTILGTEATRQQALNYGCIVENKDTHEVLHYVEKPQTFVSSIINCGIYLFTPDIFPHLATAFNLNQEEIRGGFQIRDSFEVESHHRTQDSIMMEQDVFAEQLAGTGRLYVCHTNKFWSQIKSPGAAVYANRHYLAIYHRTHPERLAKTGGDGPTIIGDVFIHPTASVHPTATLGPNVTIGKHVTVGEGVRVRESMVLEGAVLQDHCCVLHSIVGWQCTVGQWSRVEGTPCDPNPNKPFAKLDRSDLFKPDGSLNPSITVIGAHVQVPSEVILLNSTVLPHKDLERSCKNQIIL